jgi:hypothetical protein
MTVNPSLEMYQSRTACERHGTRWKYASTGRCITCTSLAEWRRRGDARAAKIATEAVPVAADNLKLAQLAELATKCWRVLQRKALQ